MRIRVSPNVLMSFFIGVGVSIILAFVASDLQLTWMNLILITPGIPGATLVSFVQIRLCEQGMLSGKACYDDVMWAALAIFSFVFWGLLFAFIAWAIEKWKARVVKK